VEMEYLIEPELDLQEHEKTHCYHTKNWRQCCDPSRHTGWTSN